MEFIYDVELSDDQRRIIELRIGGKTYRAIQAEFDPPLFPKNISSCLRWTALGFKWARGNLPGNEHYLCHADEEYLDEILEDAGIHMLSMTLADAADEAYELKRIRHRNARRFLNALDDKELAFEIFTEEIAPPSRGWVYSFIERHEKTLKTRRVVDRVRLEGCDQDVILDFIEKHGQMIKECPPELLFGADETMLDHEGTFKIISPKSQKQAIAKDVTEFPHISVMFAHNAAGLSLPPFILLPKLQILPDELNYFTKTGLIWLASAPKGWQTRFSFLIWTIHFINYISDYRTKLANELRNAPILLICDGHSSRACPTALQLMRNAKIILLILPSHCTHVLQMFDVSLASPFKKYFSKSISKLINFSDIQFSSNAAKSRYIVVRALMDAWGKASSLENILSSAAATGMHPYNPKRVLENEFVRTLTPEEKHSREIRQLRNQRRLNLNNQIITTPAKIRAITGDVGTTEVNSIVYTIPPGCTYSQIISQIRRNPHNPEKVLSEFPPYIHQEKGVIFFD